METEIRLLNSDDIKQVETVFLSAFKDDHIYNECGFELSGGLPDNFRLSIGYSVCSGSSVGYFEDGRMIAFALGFDFHKCEGSRPDVMRAVFEIGEDGSSAYEELGPFFDKCASIEELYYLMSIAVIESRRREGIASKMLDFILSQVCKSIIGDVSSMISIPMYTKRGFSIQPLADGYKLVVLERHM